MQIIIKISANSRDFFLLSCVIYTEFKTKFVDEKSVFQDVM